MLYTILLLLPAWGTPGVPLPPSGGAERPWPLPGCARSLPYLPLVGVPPLRFQEVAPVPRLQTRTPAAAPPFPDEIHPVGPADEAPETAPAAAPRDSGQPAAGSSEPTEPLPKPAPPILHDDLKPVVRPEDFLPYFLFPSPASAPAEARVIVPWPPAAPASGAPTPPSTATYSQTPE